MIKQVLNDEIKFEYPDGFELMNDEELKGCFAMEESLWGIKNPEQQLTITIGWTCFSTFFISLLSDEKALLNSFERHAKKRISSFSRGKSLSKTICGFKSKGFCFTFTDSETGTEYHGEAAAIKLGSRYYTIAYTTGGDDAFYCKQAYDMVLSTISENN